jgi:hypothetical protein
MCSKFDEFRDVKMISIVSCTIDLKIRQYLFTYFFAKERRYCSVIRDKCFFLMKHGVDGLLSFI